MNQPIHVAVAVIENACGEILIAKRPQHLHQGGLWEFPGGKVDSGETVLQALQRELQEELAISASDFVPLIRIQHDYGDKHVLLDVWHAHEYRGEPQGREGQQICWRDKFALHALPFPAANRRIITAVQLPDVMLVTPEPEDPSIFLAHLDQCLAKRKIDLVQLRVKRLHGNAYLEFAKACLEICRCYNVRLLLNSAPEILQRVAADGVHLSSDKLFNYSKRPVSTQQWLSASCHNEIELSQAKKLDADFIMLAPVLPTASHPNAEFLGWEKFSSLAKQANRPVYALGGMRREDVLIARQQGGRGIAAIRGLWND